MLPYLFQLHSSFNSRSICFYPILNLGLSFAYHDMMRVKVELRVFIRLYCCNHQLYAKVVERTLFDMFDVEN